MQYCKYINELNSSNHVSKDNDMSKTAKKVGRPTKYKPEYCEEILEYFDKPLYTEVTQQKMSASGVVKDVETTVATDIPTFEGFAVDICGVGANKLAVWAEKHEDFRAAMKKAKDIQKKFLFKHTMNGNYNASFAKFFAINCLGMKETSHVNNSHDVSEDTKKAITLAYKLEE